MMGLTAGSARKVRLSVGALAVVPLLFAMAGCGSDDSSGSEGVAVDEPAITTEVQAAGPGEYVFGAERDQMLEAVERTYQSDNASATWEGDTMVVTVDGDATESVPVFSMCRVLTMLLNEDDLVVLQYPNGRVDCEEYLQNN
ncbi:hypothetical protein CFAEC_11210 [Corynebacterium faecale]|uniref:hypothetical protein n=1 Tax=Corynebacterium faecale TaxID=1758466 RepID=UPI0025B4DB33|nr:hypothetical protein [Corynebacterium faecale]WJY93041.1 hypothetical protein CFAEC_11210 [Corynebacterium faecale]